MKYQYFYRRFFYLTQTQIHKSGNGVFLLLSCVTLAGRRFLLWREDLLYFLMMIRKQNVGDLFLTFGWGNRYHGRIYQTSFFSASFDSLFFFFFVFLVASD